MMVLAFYPLQYEYILISYLGMVLITTFKVAFLSSYSYFVNQLETASLFCINFVTACL